jgi:hypothetical protein
MSKIKNKGLLNVNSNLWNHLYDTYGLTLLESEINDILHYARQEMELPDYEEMKDYVHQQFEESKRLGQQDADMYALGVEVGAVWALSKIRNPYPKTIQFLRDDEEGITGVTDRIHPKYHEVMRAFFDKLSKDTEGMNMIEYFNYVNNLTK